MADLNLPTLAQEAWRWSGLDALRAAAGTSRGQAAAADAWFLDLPGPRILFVDGVFASDVSSPDPVEIAALDLGSEHPLGRRTAGTGWSLHVPAQGVTDTIQIVHLSTGGENHLPAQLVLAEDAVAHVVETYAGQGWANRLTRIALARSARLMRSVRLVQDSGYVSIRDEAEVGQGASLVSIFLGAGGMGSRIDGALTLSGEAAFADYGGALLTSGDQRQECAVQLRHANVNGSSRQTWRAVAADRSVASLAARVDVARGAQKTDGEQSLRGLLLQRTATVNLKPELEIFADDVKCAHGATVGELDRRALFYLRSRGLTEARAKALLTRAFVADAIDRIGDETVRDAFAADADRWLEAAL